MSYWANKTGRELVVELKSRVDSYDEYLINSGMMRELRDSYKTFYGDSEVRDAGGQKKAIRINHYASLIRNLTALVTNNKPAWQPIASNTDSESQAAAILASGLLDYYIKDRRLDRLFRTSVQLACFMREAWVSTLWDTTRGEPIAVDELGAPINEGDINYGLHTIVDVIRDFKRKDANHDWLILRETRNKYDLMAQYPEHAQFLERLSISEEHEQRFGFIRSHNRYDVESDLIHVYTAFFKPCASLPNGRMVVYVDDRMITDGPLPYPKIPLIRISSEDQADSCFAHSPMFDVLPVQKGIDTLASILLTNNSTFGVQNIQYPIGQSLNVSQIGDGLNVIAYDPKLGPLQPLQLTASAPESYRFFDLLVQQGQLLSGVNDAIRGQTSAGQSGAALALLSQQAIQFANGLQQGYVALIEDVGTLTVQILQRYANTERVAVLTGKNNRPLLKKWSGNDLMGVSRITIESGNALSKTASGRLTIADSLLQAGMIKRPEQYITVLTTGQLEPVYENEQRQLMLIRSENESLERGNPVRALLTDDHPSHILEHSSVLSQPELRADPSSPIVAATLDHIQEHLDLARNMPPDLAALLKQQSVAQPAPQQAPEGVPPVVDGTPAITTEAGEVNMPNLPVNPATNERVEPIN